MLILGLDPGGVGRFGWCLADKGRGSHLKLRSSGATDSAGRAVATVLQLIGDETVVAAGIDSPLFWVPDGDRRADMAVRAAMQHRGARNVDGTVQRVNSLRGACLVQGIMAARQLRNRFPNIRLTESHPKALLWLIDVANTERAVRSITMEHLSEFIECRTLCLSEDERDAALGAISAFAMIQKRAGWRDLIRDEVDAFAPVSPVEYWMPIA